MSKTMKLVITLSIVLPPVGFALAVILAAVGMSREYTNDKS